MQEGLIPKGEGLRGLLGGSGDRVSMSTKRVRGTCFVSLPLCRVLGEFMLCRDDESSTACYVSMTL